MLLAEEAASVSRYQTYGERYPQSEARHDLLVGRVQARRLQRKGDRQHNQEPRGQGEGADRQPTRSCRSARFPDRCCSCSGWCSRALDVLLWLWRCRAPEECSEGPRITAAAAPTARTQALRSGVRPSRDRSDVPGRLRHSRVRTVTALVGTHSRSWKPCRHIEYHDLCGCGLGSFGAFNQINSLIQSRLAVFDIGVAGALAGLVVAVPALYFSLERSLPIDPRPPRSRHHRRHQRVASSVPQKHLGHILHPWCASC